MEVEELDKSVQKGEARLVGAPGALQDGGRGQLEVAGEVAVGGRA